MKRSFSVAMVTIDCSLMFITVLLNWLLATKTVLSHIYSVKFIDFMLLQNKIIVVDRLELAPTGDFSQKVE